MKTFIFGSLCSALLIATTAEASSRGKVTGVANLNEASIEQLRELPGVSEKLAERIVEYRHSQKFTKVDDLVNVPGFNQSKVNHLKSHLSVAGESTIQLQKKIRSSKSRNSAGRRKSQGRSSKKRQKSHSLEGMNPADSPGDASSGASSKGRKSHVPSVKKEQTKSGPSAKNHQKKASAKKRPTAQGHRKRSAYTRHNARGAAKRTSHSRS